MAIKSERLKEIPMPLPQETLSKLKVQALETADNIMKQILDAYHNPQISLSGEALKIWNELEEWGFLEDYPIDDPNTHMMYRRMLAMNQFRHLRWNEEHPPSEKKKMSKWEKVTGRAARK